MENFRTKSALKEAKRNAIKIALKPHLRSSIFRLTPGAGFTESNKVALPQQKKEQLRNVTKTLSPKTGNRKLEKNFCLETVSNELLGGGTDTSFSSRTSPSIYELVQNI